MSNCRRLLLAAASAILISASAVLGGPPEVPVTQATTESPWEFRLEPYGWLAGISGTTGVLNQEVPTNLSVSNLFKHLKMTYAGQIELRYNRWGLLTDIFYADIGGYIPVRNPHLRQFALDDKLVIFQVAPNYRLYRSEKAFFDLLAGVRVMGTKLRLTGFLDDVGSIPEIIPRGYFNRSQSKTWADPIVGARGQVFLTKSVFLAAYGDIGGFGVSSELTWQVQGTLGYKFSNRLSTELGWRLLSDNYQDGGFTYNVKQQGVYSGFAFTW